MLDLEDAARVRKIVGLEIELYVQRRAVGDIYGYLAGPA